MGVLTRRYCDKCGKTITGCYCSKQRIKELETCMMCSNGKNYICDKCLVVWEKAEARQVEMLDECRKRVIALEGK